MRCQFLVVLVICVAFATQAYSLPTARTPAFRFRSREKATSVTGSPVTVTHLFHTTGQTEHQPSPKAANWAQLNPAQADDPNFDGVLGNQTLGGRPSGVFFIVEREQYARNTWYPRQGNGKYWRMKALIQDVNFWVNGGNAHAKKLHQFILFTCYPQGDSMQGNPKKPTGQGPQMLMVAVHPDDAGALTWVRNHARATTTENPNGSVIYDEKDTGKWFEHKTSKSGVVSWWADKNYLDGGQGIDPGTLNLFVIGTPDLANIDHANWSKAQHT